MKKYFTVIVFILWVLFFALSCVGQEGCGRWVEAEQGLRFTTGESAYVFWWPDSLSPPDSVWVPRESPSSTSDTDSLSQSFIDALSFDFFPDPPDTYYQESQQKWRWEEEHKQQRCQEIWECVREKLIEFLEERER